MAGIVGGMTASTDGAVSAADFERLSQRVADLEAVIARWSLNTGHVLDRQNIFAGREGTYGTSTQAARSDHAH